MGTGDIVQEVDPRYPIGRYKRRDNVSPEDRKAAIAALAEMPRNLVEALRGLDDAQLGTPYREGGWTVRQLVHHMADSHMNAFCRVRLALTEDWPAITTYQEKAWAMLPDSESGAVGWSVALIENLHARWVMLLNSLTEEQWARGMKHPVNGPMRVEIAVQLYAWHARHHVAHITKLRESRGW